MASIWEIGIKAALLKLPLPETVERYVPSRMAQLGAKALEIRAVHAIRAAALPLHHRDPFDRMLVAQAQTDEMTIASGDAMLGRYEVSIFFLE